MNVNKEIAVTDGMLIKGIEITPMGAPRMTRADAWKKRPVVERYHAYRDELRLRLGKDYMVPESLNIVFIIPMPKSWSEKKKREMDGRPHKQKPDIDNLFKGFTDAFGDDSHIWSALAIKIWGRMGAIRLEKAW